MVGGFASLAYWFFLVALASFILEQVLQETVMGVFRTGFNNLNGIFEAGLSTLREMVHGQLQDIKNTIGLTNTTTEETVNEVKAKDPGVGDLLADGKIEEAIQILEKKAQNDPSKKADLVPVLLISKSLTDWDRAWTILQEIEKNLKTARQRANLSYIYWSIDSFDKAIEIAESALHLVESAPPSKEQGELIGKFKNSLAYYYADTGRSHYEELARKYTEAACATRPGDVRPLDTKGYVKIVYGKDKQEVLEGIKLCEDARRGGTSENFYFKHIEKARRRLLLY